MHTPIAEYIESSLGAIAEYTQHSASIYCLFERAISMLLVHLSACSASSCFHWMFMLEPREMHVHCPDGFPPSTWTHISRTSSIWMLYMFTRSTDNYRTSPRMHPRPVYGIGVNTFGTNTSSAMWRSVNAIRPDMLGAVQPR